MSTSTSASFTLTPATARLAAVVTAIGTVLVLVFGIGALGVIGAAGDPADRLYVGVLAVAIIGALATRFRPRGMAVAMLATALATMLVAVDALVLGLGGANPRLEIVGLNAMFASGFLLSAWLFHRAAEGRGTASAPPA